MKDKLDSLIKLIKDHHDEFGASKHSSGSFGIHYNMANNEWSWSYGGYDTGQMNRNAYSEEVFDTPEEAIEDLRKTILNQLAFSL